jgi:3-hydroxyacyl-[acyl-carrier-protein] dehydratase
MTGTSTVSNEENNGFDIQEILELLPHRYPMLLVDKVVSYVPGESLHAVKNVTFNEPVFTGHFPGRPIFPDSAREELYLYAGIDNARFKQPVVPGDVMNLHVEFVKEKRGIWKFHCEAKVDGKLACCADLTLARRPA